ncbi:hypothetical protein COLO4_38457 [Corchorus olitorius]|uniref:Uncharacterized protein n=1 Tax=Corchorus olitorius TaxID=93759 RepID=A0A1R3FUX6_9ROSI|nr:hypothetical protein COLO4_38457 [Corchorus olitorius]
MQHIVPQSHFLIRISEIFKRFSSSYSPTFSLLWALLAFLVGFTTKKQLPLFVYREVRWKATEMLVHAVDLMHNLIAQNANLDVADMNLFYSGSCVGDVEHVVGAPPLLDQSLIIDVPHSADPVCERHENFAYVGCSFMENVSGTQDFDPPTPAKRQECLSSWFDSCVSTEIPDIDLDQVGYEAVTSFMMHGPCGVGFLRAPCMENGRCDKHFPKKFSPHTKNDQHGYPTYRRFQAHINVEICNKSRMTKYQFKYINKGQIELGLLLKQMSLRLILVLMPLVPLLMK